MVSLLDQIREFKTQAKNRRDMGLPLYPRAETYLAQAIDLGRKNLEQTELRSQIASELADCYGLLGGIQRRWALESPEGEERDKHLRDSIRAYDEGWLFESGGYGIVNSYGMVNRLISRLLVSPRALTGGEVELGEDIKPLDVRTELENASKVIQQQLAKPRRDDYWATADLALVHALLGKDDAMSLYMSFISKSPPDYAYNSVLDVLRPLSEEALPVTRTLQDAVTILKQGLERLQSM
jgi:hypothetical protein